MNVDVISSKRPLLSNCEELIQAVYM